MARYREKQARYAALSAESEAIAAEPAETLDGHHVLNYFLPPKAQRAMQQIGPFGIIIAILLAQPLFAVALPPLRSFIFIALGA